MCVCACVYMYNDMRITKGCFEVEPPTVRTDGTEKRKEEERRSGKVSIKKKKMKARQRVENPPPLLYYLHYTQHSALYTQHSRHHYTALHGTKLH